MDETTLYERIAEAIRQDILKGTLKPGDRLPPVREIAFQWNCTNGTAQRAFQVLRHQGLITSRPGQGTRVAEAPLMADLTPMRRLQLIHRAETFLLESLSGGYTLKEIEAALLQSMDRWHTVEHMPMPAEAQVLRFSGSHDPVLSWIASRFTEIAPGNTLELHFTGSLGGLMELAVGNVELAGCHLWDEEADTYNIPFVRRLFPNRKMALVTLAHRCLGLILPKDNPRKIMGLIDLIQDDLQIANRQEGSGTRVWIDAHLKRENISIEKVSQHSTTYLTHNAVAQAVAEGKADVGIGLQAAAGSLGLSFIELTHEKYDLVMTEEIYQHPAVQWLIHWLGDPAVQSDIETFGGYETRETGNITWT